jgi:tight adherence protein B
VEGEISALTAEGKMSGVILVVLPLVMAAILTILNPDYMRTLVVEPVGRLMIFGGLALQVIGGLAIKKILALDF